MRLSQQFIIKAGNHWVWSVIIVLALVGVFVVRYTLPVRDGDLWWHMLYGKYFIDNMTVIADHTIFSWTPSTNEYIYCTWIADLFFYVFYQYLGLNGLFVIRYLFMASIIILCFVFARRQGVICHPLVWFSCLIAVSMSYVAAFLKPEIFSFLFMTIIVWNWYSIRSSGENCWKRCYLFPIVMLVWVNTHGGFIFGAIFLSCITLGEILNGVVLRKNKLDRKVRKNFFYSFILSFLAVFCTPYGFNYILSILDSITPTVDNLQYMSKVHAHAPTYLALENFQLTHSANLAFIVLLVVFVLRFRKIEYSLLISNLIFAYLFSLYYRTTYFWAPVFLFSVVYLVSFSPGKVTQRSNSLLYLKSFGCIAMTIAGIWFSITMAYSSITTPESKLWMGFGIGESTPVAEAKYIAQHYPQEKIGNTYDQGAYLLWNLWPENTVMFDSRHFPYRNWSDEFFDFMNGNNVEEFIRKYPATIWCIGLNNGRLIQEMAATGNWLIAFYDKNAVVFLPSDEESPPNSKPYTDEIYNMKSMLTGIQLIQLCIETRDFVNAEKLLDVLEERFDAPNQKGAIVLLGHLINGSHAFYDKQFQTALDELNNVPPDQFSANMKVISLLHLGHQDFLNANYNDALNKFRTALAEAQYASQNMETDLTPYVFYNIGVSLYKLQSGSQRFSIFMQGYVEQYDLSNWRYYITSFLRMTEKDPYFTQFRAVVARIYDKNDESEDFPSLVPDVPVKRDYYFPSYSIKNS